MSDNRKLLTSVKDRPEDPAFEVWEEADGKITIMAGDATVVTATTSAQGIAKVTGPVVVVAKSLTIDSVGTANPGAQKLDETKFAAGDLQVGDCIRITLGLAKSGATDPCTFAIRFGKLKTASDAAILSGPSLTAGQKSAGTILVFRVTSLTTLRMIGAMSSIVPLASASSPDSPPDVTIPDIFSEDNWLSIYATMTSGVEAPAVRGLLIELLRG